MLEPHRELCKITHLWGGNQPEGKKFKGQKEHCLESTAVGSRPDALSFQNDSKLNITTLQVAMVTPGQSWGTLQEHQEYRSKKFWVGGSFRLSPSCPALWASDTPVKMWRHKVGQRALLGTQHGGLTQE